MNKNLTEIAIVLDSSGSMAKIQSDVEGGIATFLEKQKSQEGDCKVSLCRFATKVENIYENVDIRSVSPIKLNPWGNTALYDAICTTIDLVGNRLANTIEENKPSLVVFVVLTDGQENCSKNFNIQQVRDKIKHQSEKYNWQFIFLGADQDAVLNGVNMGFAANSTVSYKSSKKSLDTVFSYVNSGVVNMRKVSSAGGCSANIGLNLKKEDRDEILAN